jgi:hypothetical protein
MNAICPQCAAKHFPSEGQKSRGQLTFAACCSRGEVRVPDHTAFPPNLRQFFEATDSTGREFREHIRQYNSALAFASLNAQAEVPAGGPFTYRVHGQIYHLIGSLHPSRPDRRCFSSFYIFDPATAARERMNHHATENCNPDTMETLSTIIAQVSPFASMFKMLDTVHREETEKATAAGLPSPEMRLVFGATGGLDLRRFNLPASDHLAAIFVGDAEQGPPPTTLTVFSAGNRMSTIRETDPRCDALTYPLFFPRGDPCWHPGLSSASASDNTHRISAMDYYRAHLFERVDVWYPILRGGKLFHQYIVNMLAKVEQWRLNFLRYHQDELRAELYQGLADHLHSNPLEPGAKLGKAIILPSSYTGGPRYMNQCYQDAMALVQYLGRPHWFITFTANPKWPEVEAALLPNQTVVDRPDLVARVFKLKME